MRARTADPSGRNYQARGGDPAVVSAERVLEAVGLSVSGRRGGRPVTIVDRSDLHVAAGETVAVVGESGSGKSVAMRALLDLLPEGLRADGTSLVDGRDISKLSRSERRSLRGSELAYVMQDPFTMLNPLQKVGPQIVEALRGGSARTSRRSRRFDAVARLREVGINDPAVADKYPFQLSGGMRQRVAIAAALAEDPRILIADEPTTALDVTTQREILQLLGRLRETHRLGLIIVTHDLAVAQSVADRIYVMYAGEIVESAPIDRFRRGPKHPYSRALLAADPPVDRRVERLSSIPGSVPEPGARPTGCRFAPRCALATEVCRTTAPELVDPGDGHFARCHHVAEAERIEVVPPITRERRSEETLGEILIEARQVTKWFGDKTALAGVDITVRQGESVGIVGESGSGKTTLARSIVGLSRVTGGSIEVAGVDLAAPSISRPEWERVRSTVQMAFQDPSSTLNPHRTIGATLREGLRLVSQTDVDERAIRALAKVGLDGSYADRLPGQLSGGERQRVAIARALSREPRVVVCDEIVSALDVSVQALILNLLNDLRRDLGLTYVFITHDLAVVRQVTDRIYVMRDGKVVESGPTDEVLDHPSHEYTRELVACRPDGAVSDRSEDAS